MYELLTDTGYGMLSGTRYAWALLVVFVVGVTSGFVVQQRTVAVPGAVAPPQPTKPPANVSMLPIEAEQVVYTAAHAAGTVTVEITASNARTLADGLVEMENAVIVEARDGNIIKRAHADRCRFRPKTGVSGGLVFEDLHMEGNVRIQSFDEGLLEGGD